MSDELIRSRLGPLIIFASRRLIPLRRVVFALARKLEGGDFRSATLRDVMRIINNVEVGAHSYGACFVPGTFHAGARIGRYVSIGSGVMRRLNHPLNHLILHPYFYNQRLGHVAKRGVSHVPIEIGHDAWIGQSVIFTESCTRVGIGAVIGAGSIVTRNVGDFEVVAGNPARLIRRRFDDETCARILASRWWEKPFDELAPYTRDLGLPLSEWPPDHPLLKQRDAT
jgi:virginiamycin A acetyltransferase